MSIAAIKGETVKMVFENYRDNHIHILFASGLHLTVEADALFDSEGNHVVRDCPLLTNKEMDELLAATPTAHPFETDENIGSCAA